MRLCWASNTGISRFRRKEDGENHWLAHERAIPWTETSAVALAKALAVAIAVAWAAAEAAAVTEVPPQTCATAIATAAEVALAASLRALELDFATALAAPVHSGYYLNDRLLLWIMKMVAVLNAQCSKQDHPRHIWNYV